MSRLAHAARLVFLSHEFERIDRIGPFIAPADPFHLDHDCLHPEGHDPKMVGRQFVCVNCSKIFE